MSGSASLTTAVQSLQIPDSWKIAACYVPVLGGIVSSLCHKSLSNRLSDAYAKKNFGDVTQLLDLRKRYLVADGVRNLISSALAMVGIWIALYGARYHLKPGSGFKTLPFICAYALLNVPKADAADSRLREEQNLKKMLQSNP